MAKKKRKPKQQYIPGAEPPSIPEIDEAADDYVDLRDRRMELLDRETAAKDVIDMDLTVGLEYVQALYNEMLEAAKALDFERAQKLRDEIVKVEAELRKRFGDAAVPSVLGGKAVPVSQPEKAKKKVKQERGNRPPRPKPSGM